MKNNKLLIQIVVVEIIALFLLNKSNIVIDSWIGKTLGMFVVILPIIVLLFRLSKDENKPSNNKTLYRVLLIFIVVCYLLGVIITISL